MAGFEVANYLLDQQPIGVVLNDDTTPTPALVHSFDSIMPSHYQFTPQHSANDSERGDGSQVRTRTGLRGEFVITVSEQAPAIVDEIVNDTAQVVITVLKTSTVITFSVEAGSTYIVNTGGEVEIHFHVSTSYLGDMEDIFAIS